ncbi:MAG: hypothetical protein WC757_00665 [Candidatus Paceibacterota bacterium]|jgi:hypothetical protein
MSETIKNGAAAIFITSTVVLTFVSILGVWEVLGSDVIGKSLATGGIVLFSCIASIIASSIVEQKAQETATNIQ